MHEDDKEEEEELVEDIQKKLEDEGIRAKEDTFVLLTGKNVVIFLINNPPGQEGRALAMQLDPSAAVELGNGLVRAAILAKELDEEKPGETVPLEEPKKEFLN